MDDHDPDSDVNIQRLLRLKRVFEEADEDGSGELDIDEFVEKIGPHLGGDLTKTQLTQLFMKIDADAGGTVDWDEFTNFMFLQRAEPDEDDADNWRFFSQDFRAKNDLGCHHRAEIVHVLHFEHGEKYLTSGQDGTFRIWNASDLKHVKTMTLNASAWVTGSVYLPRSHRIAIGTSDGVISFSGIVRGTYDLLGRVEARDGVGAPQCLCYVEADDEECLVVGDDNGCVALLLEDLDEAPSRSSLHGSNTANNYAFEILHEHSDWVTQVRDIREIGLVSSSLDATVRIYDVARGCILQTYNHHRRGVHAFEWCSAYSLFASAGVERNIRLWQAGTNARKVGELVGHTSCVTQLAIDEKSNNLISLSLDRSLKVWDLRSHKCLQTIDPDEWPKHVDSNASCMTYDRRRRRLLTCSNRIVIWPHKLVSQDKSGHQYPVRQAIYNSTFHVALSADEEGTVCVWNMDDGSRESKFCASHGPQAKLTTATFDSNQRRLLTAANSGSLKMWNFNSGPPTTLCFFDQASIRPSGRLLREYVHGIQDLEITTALFVPDVRSGSDRIIASGWSSKIFVWEDRDEDEVFEHRTLCGHADDVLHVAVCREKDLLATGDYEGQILIWNASTGVKQMRLFHKAERYEASVEKLTWLPTVSVANGKEAVLLLSAAGDGIIRVWHIAEQPRLITSLSGAHGRLEQVSALQSHCGIVVVGDTAGHVRVLDLSQGIDLSSRITAKQSFHPVAHWLAHEETVTSIGFVSPDNGPSLLLTCSKDTDVALWTLRGGLVGFFGVDTWKLDDPSTWKDSDGCCTHPPRPASDMFLTDDAEESESDEIEIRETAIVQLEHKLQTHIDASDADDPRGVRLKTYPLASFTEGITHVRKQQTTKLSKLQKL